MRPLYLFSEERFLEDLQNACAALEVPYSEQVTRKVLSTFQKSFERGSVLWKTTDKPNGELNYRFYERESIDQVDIARKSEFISHDNPLGNLAESWGGLYGNESHQFCDFDSNKGLVKFWIYLGGIRPLDQVLNVNGVPNVIRQHQPVFESLHLTSVRHTAVDIEKESVNLYFFTHESLTRDEINEYLQLARADPISDNLFKEVKEYFPFTGGTFSVTMDFHTGIISRVAFYASRLSPNKHPTYNDRIKKFLEVSTSYDDEDMCIIVWSFGANSTYMKAEHSHSGQLVSLFRDWNSPMSSE
ncbi:prenyltransferase-like protein [Xylogone sp. PMI_703]|nr:prenyltransferase-like protein [Xylogone sp. PMI_703]